MSGMTLLARAPSWTRWAVLAGATVVALWLPMGIYPAIAVDILCWAMFAVAVDLLLGFAGLLSFGHAAFWGTSAYTTGLLAVHSGVPFPVAVLGGALVAAVLALPIGYLAVKRTGIYFAMVTLAFAQMIYYVANEWRSLTGGENGLQGIPRDLFGLDLTDSFYFYYAALPIVAGGLFAAWRIVNSPFGRVLVAIRDNTARARALGYPAQHYKVVAFVLSAFLAGLGGGMFAVAHGFVSLDTLHWTTSGKAVIVVVLGGIGTLWGGVVGAALLIRLEDWLSVSGVQQIGLVTGGIFVLVVLLFRRGLVGTAGVLLRWLARRSRGRR
jgi:branched-chain amino acid transport system permease protein